jgi:hypothetical protein
MGGREGGGGGGNVGLWGGEDEVAEAADLGYLCVRGDEREKRKARRRGYAAPRD